MGEASYGTKIQNCSFKGNVCGENYVGGIAGRYYGGATVLSCYANADVNSDGIVNVFDLVCIKRLLISL